jgi:hypothetical protein
MRVPMRCASDRVVMHSIARQGLRAARAGFFKDFEVAERPEASPSNCVLHTNDRDRTRVRHVRRGMLIAASGLH